MSEGGASAPLLAIGCTVRISGLVKKPELNGKEGIVIGNDEEKGRWHIQTKVQGRGKSKALSLKTSNLTTIAGPAININDTTRKAMQCVFTWWYTRAQSSDNSIYINIIYIPPSHPLRWLYFTKNADATYALNPTQLLPTRNVDAEAGISLSIQAAR